MKQKLDMDHGRDGGYIEYKNHRDSTWESVFGNPYIYNIYGFDTINADTLMNGDSVFTGTDTLWKDIWLCFDYSFNFWQSNSDTLFVRFVFVSDSIDNSRDGWMIDNMLAHRTYIHTVEEVEKSEYLNIFPVPTDGRINIEARKINDYHIIEEIELRDKEGRIVKKWGRAPTKFFIDIGDQAEGLYYLRVTTNLKTEVHQVLLQKNP